MHHTSQHKSTAAQTDKQMHTEQAELTTHNPRFEGVLSNSISV